MTKREIYTEAIARYTNATDEFGIAMLELATKELNALDAAAKRTADKRAEKHKADEPIIAAILEGLAKDTPTTTADIAAAVGVNSPKASYLLRTLESEGKVVSHEVALKGRKCKGYTLV